MKKFSMYLMAAMIFIALTSNAADAQTTEFTFQGSLKDGAAPANANYDFEFALFNALSAGSQIGATIPKNNVPVTSGIFSVKLDFGATFPGANRFLEIRVRPAGGGAYTPLAPRQFVNSAPYSVKGLSAASADTVNAGNITGVLGASQGGTGIGPNPPFAGSFLRSDGTGWTQDGIHTSDIPPGSGSYIQNRTSQQGSTNFNISGDGTVGGNLNADIVRATTHYSLGGLKVFSTAGTNNLFVGSGIGASNTGTGNSFFGTEAGNANQVGSFNTFIGRWSGFSNIDGDSNTFAGFSSGKFTTTGDSNSFFGNAAGNTNTTGSSNAALGAGADVGANNLTHATAIGAGAVVSLSDEIALGRAGGGDRVRIPGFAVVESGANFFGVTTTYGPLQLEGLSAAGSTSLCLNSNDRVATCSSSLRYKTNLAPYSNGLNVLNHLRPITFDWKEGGMHDLGLGAEDVEKIDPLLVTYNKQGEVEGVKYDRIGIVLINVVKEQQTQIEAQQAKIGAFEKQNQSQQKQIQALRQAICSLTPALEICKPKEQ